MNITSKPIGNMGNKHDAKSGDFIASIQVAGLQMHATTLNSRFRNRTNFTTSSVPKVQIRASVIFSQIVFIYFTPTKYFHVINNHFEEE